MKIVLLELKKTCPKTCGINWKPDQTLDECTAILWWVRSSSLAQEPVKPGEAGVAHSFTMLGDDEESQSAGKRGHESTEYRGAHYARMPTLVA